MQVPPSSRRPAAVGLFGKIPSSGDFVRLGWSNETTRALEEWLHRGVEHAHERQGNGWKRTFQSGTMYAFVMRSPAVEGALLGGVISPSQDSVGRAFPLAIFTALDPATPPHVHPMALGSFLEEAAALAGRAAGLAATELDAAAHSLGGPEDPLPYANAYDWWARGTRVAQLWDSVFGSAHDLSAPTRALATLLEAIGPLRDRPIGTSPLSLRVPLGRGGVHSAMFWVDVVCSAMRWTQTTPTSFWTFDGYRGDILIQFGRTPVSSFKELWAPDPRNDHVVDLLGTSPTGESLSRLPYAIRRCFEVNYANVGDLLGALRT